MNFIKGFIRSLFALVLIILFASTVCASNPCVSWYCIRTKNHSQPPIGKDLKFSENYNLFWCDKKANSENKVVYLTFDAGYENGNVRKIVDILKEENVTGAFFVLDNLVRKNPDLIREMIKNGNIVANHTAGHKDITRFNTKEDLREEIVKLEKVFEENSGQAMQKYFRPPEGKLSEQSLKWLDEMGYKTVMWSFAYEDWNNNSQPSKEVAKKKILDNIHNGEVMLLHPTSKTNAEILKEIIVELKNQGYRFGTIDELCS